jgi:hypothetical protein
MIPSNAPPRKLPERLDGREAHLSHPSRTSTKFVFKTLYPLLFPPINGSVDSGAVDAQIAGYDLHAAAVKAQLYDRSPPLPRVFHLGSVGIL